MSGFNSGPLYNESSDLSFATWRFPNEGSNETVPDLSDPNHRQSTPIDEGLDLVFQTDCLLQHRVRSKLSDCLLPKSRQGQVLFDGFSDACQSFEISAEDLIITLKMLVPVRLQPLLSLARSK